MLPEDMDPTRTAVLVIDVQNDFFHKDGAVALRGESILERQRIVESLLELISQSRLQRVPVVFVKTEYTDQTDSPAWKARIKRNGKVIQSKALRAATWGADFYAVAPGPNEVVVVKTRYSAFHNTDLEDILRSQGIDTLVLAGTDTNICVESAARDGICRDYSVIVVDDCTCAATEEAHDLALSRIGEYFGYVTNSKELVRAWKQSRE